MESDIERMARDIGIHKDVEKELAKRSHFCQKVIQRLKAENKELTQKFETDLLPPKAATVRGRNGSLNLTQTKSRAQSDLKGSYQDELRSSEELINFLESKL
jgi:hypothetical protein